MKKHYISTVTLLACLLLLTQPQKLFAQSSNMDTSSRLDANTVDEVDKLLQQTPSAAAEETDQAPSDGATRPLTKKELKKLNISDYSSILTQASYDDYSVIQRNFMPKTNRTQVKAGFSSVTNDVFYANLGIGLGATYYFNETWGIGATANLLSSSRNNYAQNIKDVQLVNIENLVTLKNTLGVNIVFTPIYGKWSLLNKKVIPFELYIQGGGAQVTNQDGLSSSAFTAGLGQLISLSRSTALDINLNWYFYNTENINGQEQSNNSMLLTVAYSIFWPKPTYR